MTSTSDDSAASEESSSCIAASISSNDFTPSSPNKGLVSTVPPATFRLLLVLGLVEASVISSDALVFTGEITLSIAVLGYTIHPSRTSSLSFFALVT